MSHLHWRVWLLSAMGILLDGFDFFIVGVAIPLLRVYFDASAVELGLVSSAAVLGAMAGAATLGGLTDRIGRKVVLTLDLAFFVVFSIVCALAPTIGVLIAFRFLLGVCIGADYPLSASYLSEVAPARHRKRLLVSAFALQAVGQLLGALVGLGVLLVTDDVGAWRWMLAAGIVPAAATALLRRGLPESPRWLASVGRRDDAAAVTSVFVGRPVSAAQVVADPAAPRVGFTTLFRGALRRRTVLASVPWFFMDIATYGVGVFTPTILAAMAITGDGTFLSDDIASTEGAAVVDVFLIVGFALAIVLIGRVDAVRLQTTGFAAMAAGLLALSLASALPGGGDDHLWLVFLGFGVFNLFMNAGPNATTFLMPTEIFPSEVRAGGHGLATSAGKAGAAVGLFFFPLLQDGIGLAWTLVLIAATSALAGTVTHVLRSAAGLPPGTAAGGPAG